MWEIHLEKLRHMKFISKPGDWSNFTVVSEYSKLAWEKKHEYVLRMLLKLTLKP